MADDKPELMPDGRDIPVLRTVWGILTRAVKKFSEIDGATRAAAFSHYAFFALFPLIVLFVTMFSFFIDKDRAAGAVIAYVKAWAPISGDMQASIFDTIGGVVNARGPAGVIALVMLVWAAMRFFTALISAINKAWGTEIKSLWRLPLKSLTMLGITTGVVLLGMAVPVLMNLAKPFLFIVPDLGYFIFTMANFIVPLLMVFFGLTLLYRLGPRRPTRFSEVWAAALCAAGSSKPLNERVKHE